MRTIFACFSLVLFDGSAALAQDDKMSSHPDGDSPLARMVALAHSEALPKCDKIELFALDFRAKLVREGKEDLPKERAFPVRPYNANATILDSTTLDGAAVERISKAWQAMTFDKWAGAFCHEPAYGLRFYRDGKMLFETSVCWKCNNFYMPEIEHNAGADGKKGEKYQWYGFRSNDASKALLSVLRKQLPHPQLK